MKLLLIMLLALPLTLPATTLYFNFSGFQETDVYTAVGSGVIVFPDGSTSVGLADLTGFRFVETTDYIGQYPSSIPDLTTNVYTLADLSSFSLQLSADNTPATFALESSITSTIGVPQPERFEVSGDQGVYEGVLFPEIAGRVAFSSNPAPEPATLSLCGLSALLAGFGASRRVKR